jgi:heme exporter protein B
MIAILIDELKFYFKKKSELIYFIGLFFSIILLVPFGQVNNINQDLGNDILWVALIVATMLHGVGLFERDHQSGRLESFQTSGISLEVIVGTKWIGYWLAVVIPLLVMFPIIGVLLNIDIALWWHTLMGLISGAVPLTLVIALAGAITVGQGNVRALISLIVVPLTIPVIIFGAHYLTVKSLFDPSIFFLWGMSILLLPILCLAGASAIRHAN